MKSKSDTRLLEQMVKNLRRMNGQKIEWGIFDDAIHPNPRGEDRLAVIAQWVNDGHDMNVPPRPFFDNAIQDNYKDVRRLIKNTQRRVLRGTLRPEAKIKMIAEKMASDLKQSIIDLDSPPLRPTTIAARQSRGIASDDPLIETGALLNAVRYKITKVG